MPKSGILSGFNIECFVLHGYCMFLYFYNFACFPKSLITRIDFVFFTNSHKKSLKILKIIFVVSGGYKLLKQVASKAGSFLVFLFRLQWGYSLILIQSDPKITTVLLIFLSFDFYAQKLSLSFR